MHTLSADFIAFRVSIYGNGSPATHCGGVVAKSNVKSPDSVALRPFSGHGHGESYSARMLIWACNTRWSLLDRIWRSRQVNGRDSPGGMSPTPRGNRPTCWNELSDKTTWTIPHRTVRFLIGKRRLRLLTIKGVSNANPVEGAPGEKIGAVGHGAPKNVYIAPTKARGGPRHHPTSRKICR